MTAFVILSALFLLMLFGLVGISLKGGATLIQRRTSDPADNPQNHGMSYEEVHFPSRYRAMLQGWWIPAVANKGTIIFCQGQNGSMERHLTHIKPLYQAGYNVLLFNFRAHGGSEGPHVTFGVYEKEDLLGAIDFLVTQKNIEQMAVMGVSMGAGVALIGGALSDRVPVLIVDGVYYKFLSLVQRGMAEQFPRPLAALLAQLVVLGATLHTNTRMYQVSPILWAKHLPPKVAVLFIHGEKDQFITLAELERLADDVKGPHQIWIAPNSKHRQTFKEHPETYMTQVVGWLERYLK